jgi:hypothetical protein
MNFAFSTVQLSRNGDVAVANWRQDCGAGDVITAALSYTVGIVSYRWRLIGRPEGSGAGGVGPEPLYLGSSASAAFTVDIPGTYMIECLVNGGSPDATIIVGGVAYPETFTNPLGLLLRLLGPGETDQDNADPQVAQGWIKMLNRWLKVMRAFVSQAALFLSDRIPLPDGVGASGTGNEATRWDHVHPLIPVTTLAKRYWLTANASDNSGHTLLSLVKPAATTLQPSGGGIGPLHFDSAIGEPGLLDWPSGIVTAVIRCRVLNTQDGNSYRLDGAYETNSETYTVLAREPVDNQGSGGLKYQTAPWPGGLDPPLTGDWQTITFPITVTQQGWPLFATDRLLLNLQALLDIQPHPLDQEIFEIAIGDSYLDTLFTPSDGSSGGDTYKVKTDDADTQPDYLDLKIVDSNNNPLAIVTVGGVRKVQLPAPAPDDHKVKRDVAATPVYGDQLLVSPNGSISQVDDPESDSIDIQVVCASDLPLPDAPVASAGDPNDQPSSKRHVHPLVPPDTYGGKLWTGFVPDTRQRAAVDAMYLGDADGLFTADWTAIGTGIWRRKTAGLLPSILTDNVWPWLNMRLLAAANGLSTADQAAQGIYVLTDTGASTSAPLVYYLGAGGVLLSSPPTDSGVLSGNTFNLVGFSNIVFETPAGVPNLTSWPAAAAVPITFWARISNPSGNVYQLFLNSTSEGGGNTAYALARDTGPSGDVYSYQSADVPLQPLSGAWQQFTVNVPVGALTTSAGDRLVLTIRAIGPSNDPGCLQVAFGGSMPGSVAPPFAAIATPHYATMQRAADADTTADFQTGMYCLVNGGIGYHGQTLQATLPTPFELDVNTQSWATVDPAPTPTPENSLLTAAQLSLASPYDARAIATVSAGSGEQTLVICTEHTADLGGTTLPGAGPWRAHVRVSLATDDPTAATVVKVYVQGANEGSTWHLIGTTSPLHNTDDADWICPAGSLGADYAMAFGEKLRVRFTATSTSFGNGGVEVALTWNNAAHSTFLEVPVTLGNAGTDDHQQLVDRGVFLTPGGSTKYAHPQSAIEPGRVHSPTGPAVASVSGWLTMPQSNTCRVGGAEPLLGVATDATGADPWQEGDEICLWVESGRIIQDSAPGRPTGFAVFSLGQQFVDPNNPDAGGQIQTTSFSCLHFIYDGGIYWYLSTPPVFQ